MTNDKYILNVTVLSFLVVALVVGLNVGIDFYGLFFSTEGRNKQVYHHELISKYLFSYNYIPENFNAILIGPSLSDNLNTERLSTDTLAMYNASVMGANIYELNQIAKNIIDRGNIRSVVVCLHPYMTKDFGSKGIELNKDLYYGALGSMNLYHSYFFYLIREYNLLPNKYTKSQFTSYGTTYYASDFAVDDIEVRISEQALLEANRPIEVNNLALNQLGELIDYLKRRDIAVVGYYHPFPQAMLEANAINIQNYQDLVKKFFDINHDVLIDFNNEKYKKFRLDYSNYIDHGHLSDKGAEFIENELTAILHK